jgi:hypothetical protein
LALLLLLLSLWRRTLLLLLLLSIATFFVLTTKPWIQKISATVGTNVFDNWQSFGLRDEKL